jgi:hypothetical protein
MGDSVEGKVKVRVGEEFEVPFPPQQPEWVAYIRCGNDSAFKFMGARTCGETNSIGVGVVKLYKFRALKLGEYEISLTPKMIIEEMPDEDNKLVYPIIVRK